MRKSELVKIYITNSLRGHGWRITLFYRKSNIEVIRCGQSFNRYCDMIDFLQQHKLSLGGMDF